MKWFEDLDISLTEKDLEELFLPFDPARSKDFSASLMKPPVKIKERLWSRIFLLLSRDINQAN